MPARPGTFSFLERSSRSTFPVHQATVLRAFAAAGMRVSFRVSKIGIPGILFPFTVVVQGTCSRASCESSRSYLYHQAFGYTRVRVSPPFLWNPLRWCLFVPMCG